MVPERSEVHFLYQPEDTSLFDAACPGQVLTVLVLARYLLQPSTATGKLYGGSSASDFYHPDSDIALAAMHAGLFHPSLLPAKLYGACVELAVHPGQLKFCPKERAGVCSKPWTVPSEVSFQPIRLHLLYATNKVNPRKTKPRRLLPVCNGRAVMFDNTNRLRQAYHISLIRDRGFEEKDYTSTRFRGESLYLGSGPDLFELSLAWKAKDTDPEAEKEEANLPPAEPIPQWQWAKLRPAALDILIAMVVVPKDLPRLTVPLAATYKETVVGDLAWNELKWDPAGLTIRGTHHALTTMEWKKAGDALGDCDAYTEQDFFPDADLEDDKAEEVGWKEGPAAALL